MRRAIKPLCRSMSRRKRPTSHRQQTTTTASLSCDSQTRSYADDEGDIRSSSSSEKARDTMNEVHMRRGSDYHAGVVGEGPDTDHCEEASAVKPPSSSVDTSTRPWYSPSAEYLAISSIPSVPLSCSSQLRKLLILDLNGTLLLRSPRPPRSRNTYDALGRLHVPRTVYRRPYLGTFVRYIFHEEVQGWLDTMVWSSARPHNVADMTDKCFGEAKVQLAAIWTRDDMGLTESEYHRKTQTTKDLRKAWAEFPSYSSREPRQSLRSHLYPPASAPEVGGPVSMHSARTTFLLDDSPRKAVLQPYNHIWIPEYDKPRRSADLGLFHKQHKNHIGNVTEDDQVEGMRLRDDRWEEEWHHVQGPRSDHKVDDRSSKGGQQRKKKKASRNVEVDRSDYLDAGGQYDQTLLAIVGILDALKSEDNVSSWIRSGGLWTERIRASSVGPGAKGSSDASEEAMSSVKKSRLSDFLESPAGTSARTVDGGVAQGDAVWWADAIVLQRWTRRGLDALAILGIDPVPGIEK